MSATTGRGRKHRRGLALLLGAAGALSACAIQPDSAPRDIPEDHQERELATGAAGAEARGSDRIFLLAPGDPEQPLRTVLRDTTGDPRALLTELVSGPNLTEFEAGFRSAVPQTLEVHSARIDDGVVEIEVNDALLDLSGGELTDAVAQIVLTASELPGANSVLIRVDGVPGEWPNGSGVQQRAPLTVYDFVGYAESAQPPYPAYPATPAAATSTSTTAAPTTVPTAAPATSTTVP